MNCYSVRELKKSNNARIARVLVEAQVMASGLRKTERSTKIVQRSEMRTPTTTAGTEMTELERRLRILGLA